MTRASIKKIVLTGLMIALTFITTCVTRIPGPVPPGYINFGDVVIMMAAILIGRYSGLIAGAVGSAAADIALGGLLFAPVTLVVKGLEGYITGVIGDGGSSLKGGAFIRIAAVAAGALTMVAGYFLAEMYVLGLFDDAFGAAAALTELPLNLVQGGVSAAVGYVLVGVLEHVGVRKILVK